MKLGSGSLRSLAGHVTQRPTFKAAQADFASPTCCKGLRGLARSPCFGHGSTAAFTGGGGGGKCLEGPEI